MANKKHVEEMRTYFQKRKDFITPQREKQIIREISKSTGFIPGKLLYRSDVYDRKKIKDVIYEGAYKNRLSVCKVQGLQPAMDEADLIKAFTAQNRSKLVRAPKVYMQSKWNAKRGYGFFIMEKIDGGPIYNASTLTGAQMRNFVHFYQEYATKAMRKPFMVGKRLTPTGSRSFDQVDYWRKVCESKGRLKLEDYASCVMRYYPIFAKHAAKIPIVFGQANIWPAHVFKLRTRGWILLDYYSFRYMPRWLDLAMNTWNCWMEGITDSKASTKSLINFVERWRRCYKSIPVVKKDKDFDHTFYTLLLNRSVGTLTADLGAAPRWGDPKNRKLLRNNVKIHNHLFNYLVDKVESFDV